jgi:hypothetical protein
MAYQCVMLTDRPMSTGLLLENCTRCGIVMSGHTAWPFGASLPNELELDCSGKEEHEGREPYDVLFFLPCDGLLRRV